MNIIMGGTVKIDRLRPQLREFLATMFNMSEDECCVTDESQLSDFTFSGEWGPSDGEYLDMAEEWEEWVLQRLEKKFGVVAGNTSDRIVDLLEMIGPL